MKKVPHEFSSIQGIQTLKIRNCQKMLLKKKKTNGSTNYSLSHRTLSCGTRITQNDYFCLPKKEKKKNYYIVTKNNATKSTPLYI